MMKRLEAQFAAAEAVSHADLSAEKLIDHLPMHLTEAHALGGQTVELFEKGVAFANTAELKLVFDRQLEATRGHLRLTEQRLQILGKDESIVKDAALRLGGLNWSLFFKSQADTVAKFTIFLYAVVHLEIAGLELLKRTAIRASDTTITELCQTLLDEKRVMAGQLQDTLAPAVQATYAELAR